MTHSTHTRHVNKYERGTGSKDSAILWWREVSWNSLMVTWLQFSNTRISLWQWHGFFRNGVPMQFTVAYPWQGQAHSDMLWQTDLKNMIDHIRGRIPETQRFVKHIWYVRIGTNGMGKSCYTTNVSLLTKCNMPSSPVIGWKILFRLRWKTLDTNKWLTLWNDTNWFRLGNLFY